MTTIKTFTRTLVPTFALLLALPACGGDGADKKGNTKGEKQAKVDDGGDKTKDSAGTPEVDTPEADMPTLDPKVEKAVTLANKVADEPGRADAILEEAGMDRDSFHELLYQIAQDPELSKSYAIARDA